MVERKHNAIERGSASIEYVVITIAMMVLLFAPFFSDGSSVVNWFLDSLRAFQANSTYLLSLP